MVPDRPMVDSQPQVLLSLLGDKCVFYRREWTRPGLQVQRPQEAARKEAEGRGRVRPAGSSLGSAPRCAGTPAPRRAPREAAKPESPVPEKDRAGDSRFHDERGVVSVRGLPGAVLSKQRTPARPKCSLGLKEQKPPRSGYDFLFTTGGHVSSEKFRRIKVLEGAPGRGNGNTETFQRLTQFPDLTPLLTVITAPLSLAPQLYHEDNHSSHSRGVW
ncbi:unnamed protein product [Nyctereutes procyonoides]|uniref:(raccoon dog) hypothetical protein n=1 Tax=Nyctereutes procyonoides TaxID=34880 RepID=A0A811ZGZ6_NYCPR|nr:unnamed protein product [Nyctereutes procyonoides]